MDVVSDLASLIPAHVPKELVQDWNFQTAPGLDTDPVVTMDALRAGPDIVYSVGGRRGRSTWVVKRYDQVIEALQNTEHFSSDRYSGFSQLLGEDWPMIPVEVDPPFHRPFRMFLNKVFAPGPMSKLETGILETVRALVDETLPRKECDFQAAIGRPLPTTVFLQLMGLPLDHAARFLEWEDLLMHGVELSERAAGVRAIKDYLVEKIADRMAHPNDDVLSYVSNGEMEGRALTLQEKIGMCFVLYAAGLDTVAAALGFSIKYLAQHPDRQAELRANPSLRTKAIEELLRANSNVVIGRWVARDITFHGVAMKKGDFISLPTMFANRDPERFTDPAQLNFSRAELMRHVSFGSGPHNCIGSHLARRELRIVLDEWLDRVPQFRIKDGDRAVTYGSAVFGVDYLPLQW
jgi:cytochrome P450